MQISQLVVRGDNGINYSLGKQCFASSVYTSSTPCTNAIDGTLANRVEESGNYIAAISSVHEWFLLDLGAPVLVTSVVYYNRGSSQQRAIGTELQLINQDGVVTASALLMAPTSKPSPSRLPPRPLFL